MFKSILGIATDAARIVAAPIEIAADITRAVTKPMADIAQDAVEAIKEEIEDIE